MRAAATQEPALERAHEPEHAPAHAPASPKSTARGRPAAGPGEALLLLPTYGAVQHTLRTALVRWDARGLLDQVFVTFTSAGERFLPGFRVRSLASQEQRDRLLASALARVDAPLLRAVRDARGFRSRVLRLLKDVKQGALPPAEGLARLAERAERLAPGPRERLTACAAVAQAYQALLAEAGLEDHEDVLHRLLVQLRAEPHGWAPALLAVDGFDDVSPVEEQILLALVARTRARGGEVLISLPHDASRPALFASAAGLRARLLAQGFVEQALTGFPRAPGGALERLAAGLFGPATTPVPGGDEVLLLEADDPDDEADRVAREVRDLLAAAGRPGSPVRGARDVLVVLPDPARRAPRVLAALARLGVPAQTEAARTLEAEPWVRAVAGVLPVLAGPAPPGTVEPARGSAASLHAGSEAGPLVSAPDLLSALRYGALHGTGVAALPELDAQDLAWREAGFPADWDGLCAAARPGLRPALDALQAWRARLAEPGPVLRLLEALDACVPLPPPAGLDAEGRPLDAAHDRRLALALRARAQVLRIVEERAQAGAQAGRAPTPAQAAADLLETLPRVAFQEHDRRLDVVHVVDPDAARSWEAAVVVLLGLDEDGLPRRPVEDPLLGDDDRAALAEQGGLDLPTSATYQGRERRRLLTLLTRARRRLLLVRARRGADGEELPPSPLLDEVRRVLVLTPVRTPPGPVPGVTALSRCATGRDVLRWAAAVRGARGATSEERAAAQALLPRLDADLPRRAARWRRRAADPLPDAARARLAASVARLSASRIDAGLACPQRHFLMQVLGVPGDEVPLTGPRQGPLDLGRLAHAALERALSSPALSPEQVAAAVLDAEGLAGPERPPLLGELTRMAALLREREAATAGALQPLAAWLERAFEAVTLGEGAGAFTLVGRLDRVDVAGTRAVVVDYKLGGAAPADHARGALAGDDLQLPLYAAALERQAGFQVVGLEWISAARRLRASVGAEDAAPLLLPRAEGRKPSLLPPERFEALLLAAQERASDFVRRVKQGDTALRPRDAAACGLCPVREACRPDEAALRRELRLSAGAGAGAGAADGAEGAA